MQFPRSVVLSIMLAVTLASAAQAQIMPVTSGIARREQAGSIDVTTNYTRARTEHPGAAWPFEDRAFFYYDTSTLRAGDHAGNTVREGIAGRGFGSPFFVPPGSCLSLWIGLPQTTRRQTPGFQTSFPV